LIRLASSALPFSGVEFPANFYPFDNLKIFPNDVVRNMSFWKQSPGPYWSHTFTNFIGTAPQPHIFKETFEKPTFAYDLLTEKHVGEIYELLHQHYSMYPRSKVSVTKDQLTHFLGKEKCLAIGIYFNLLLVGFLLSRPLGFLMMGTKSLENQQLGLIDFFCVHEKHRKKGVGSKLLHAMAYETSQRGYVTHLFLKEGMPLTYLPPLYSSNFIWRRRRIPAPVNLSNFIRPAVELPRDCAFWNAPQTLYHTKVYECFAFTPSIYVGVTDLFHKSNMENLTMGEISWVWYNPKKGTHGEEKIRRVLETIVDSSSEYDIVFMDTAIPHDGSLWTTDALFSYYIWNFHPGSFFKTRPALTF
jgi:GNAT superfamily N-acetyltransferase